MKKIRNTPMAQSYLLDMMGGRRSVDSVAEDSCCSLKISFGHRNHTQNPRIRQKRIMAVNPPFSSRGIMMPVPPKGLPVT